MTQENQDQKPTPRVKKGRTRAPSPSAFKEADPRINVAGPVITPDLVQARRLNRHEVERVLNRWVYATKDDLRVATENPATPMIDLCVIRILVDAAKYGDPRRLEFIFNYLGCKPKEIVEVTSSLHMNMVDFIEIHEKDYLASYIEHK